MKKIIRNLRKFKYPFIEDKRQRFAVQTACLTTGLLITQLIWDDYRFFMVAILSLATYLLTIWSLHEDIKGVEWLMLFILPTLFTGFLSMFYFLLPGRWISRLVTTSVFAVGSYAVLLVENIYNVAAQRSIQLIRAAQSVGLLITVVTVFLASSLLYSLRLSFLENFLYAVIVSFVLALQTLWSVQLKPQLTAQIFIYSAAVSLFIGEITLCLSFWPVENAVYSLFLASAYYSSSSILQQNLLNKFFINTAREYLIVFIFIFAMMILTTSWGG